MANAHPSLQLRVVLCSNAFVDVFCINVLKISHAVAMFLNHVSKPHGQN